MEKVNFNVVQGDTFRANIVYKNPDGSPVNLTGYSARMDVRNEPSGKILCASINDSNGIEIYPTDGMIEISFSSSQTRKFTLPTSSYQLKIVEPSGSEITLLYGNFSTSAAIIK